ncbi:MAG: glycosyltransferase [Eubacteriales bacterium]
MKMTFVSNYFNHHQLPLSNALYEALGTDYCFLQTIPMEAERVEMGWQEGLEHVTYVRLFHDCVEESKQLILTSDIVIFGGVEDESYIQERLQQGKLVLRYSERLYREGVWKAISPRGLWKKYHDHTKYRNKPVYLLCSGGYVAYDFSIVRAYANKMFRFGYFPEYIPYELNQLMERKPQGTIQLLWAGRFLTLKHPEMVLHVAKHLKKQEVPFHINVVGGGELEPMMKEAVANERLEDVITLHGFQSPACVRTYMEQSNIFLFTSDYREGWGAVLNEAMNAGCAVVASHAIGAVPFLVQQGENGLIYQNGNVEEFVTHVQNLVENASLRERLGRNAYDTISTQWNAGEVAQRLLKLCEKLIKCDMIWEETGPLSKAPVVKERKMYGVLNKKSP